MIIVLTGVAGVGKTTVGQRLAGALGWRFVEADDYHPPANIATMRAGIPLSDADRQPWLAALRGAVDERLARGESAVVTCSCLKRAYRDALAEGREALRFVHLVAGEDVLRRRLQERHGHFADARLLNSQLATQDELEDGPAIEAVGSPDDVVTRIREALRI